MTTPVLEAKQLKKRFLYPSDVTILKGVDLAVYPQETVAIMGRSGEGKSTLLHILGTLEKPCDGELYIQGKKASPFTHNNLRNQHIGFVFQSFHLLEDYTVIENILMPARIARQSTEKGSPAYKRASELLQQVGLESRATFFAKQLSGGKNNASQSPAPSLMTRNSSSPTSPPATSTAPPRTTSTPSSSTLPNAPARPSSWSPTTKSSPTNAAGCSAYPTVF